MNMREAFDAWAKPRNELGRYTKEQAVDVARHLERVLASVEPITESGCWIWTGGVLNSHGYACPKINKRTVPLHRWVYEAMRGPVGDLVIDHLCRVRCCINPAHLEAVPASVNTARGFGISSLNKLKTTCPKGHPYDGRVTLKDGSSYRICVKCRLAGRAITDKRRRDAKRANRIAEGK